MRRWSLLAAVLAALLSVLLHGLGLNLTVSDDRPSPPEAAGADVADIGGGFEDFADITPEAAAPGVTPPEEVSEETPTSQALVASDNPQDVIAPDTGTAEVSAPDAAAPTEGDAPAPDIAEAEGGEDETVADVVDVAIAQPVAPDTEADVPEEAEAPVEVLPEAILSPVVPSSDPATAPDPDMQAPVPPEITVTSVPDEPDILIAEDPGDLLGAAVTTSLRPPKERPTVVALATPGAVQPRRAQPQRATGMIESPLTAYRRTGIDPFAGLSGGARAGTGSLRGAFNPGNAGITNYAGQVLVQLNRAPTIDTSARGTAEVAFEIAPDGSVAGINILSSTGTGDIRRAAAAQVRRAAPFPRPPDGTSQRLVFSYRKR